MNAGTLWLVVGMLFVVVVLAAVAYAIFEATPLASHDDRYRDPVTHKRRYDSPHLESWAEFEQRERNA